MATIAERLPVGGRWTYEVKWDGYRALLLKDGGRARLLSRNLKDLTTAYPHIAAAAPSVTDESALIDGEIVAVDEHGVPSFQALQHRSLARRAVVFYAFDLLNLAGRDQRARPLAERRGALEALRFSSPILLSQTLPGEAAEVERVVRAAGLEGVVAKRMDSVYQSGRRSPAWVKVRFSKRQEFVIGGYKPLGKGFDSVLVGYFAKREFQYAGKVRAGFAPNTRAELFEMISGREIPACPFANLPNSTGRSHWGEGITAEDMTTLAWVKPRVVIDVAFTEWTAGNNLRHASFVGVRTDKRPAAVVRET